jgi:hypothetical protein
MADLHPKDCPFCGHTASIENAEPPHSDREASWFVGCDNTEIECPGYQSLTTFPTQKQAIEAWNKRPSIEPTLRAAFIDGFEWALKGVGGHLAAWAQSRTKRELTN